jgi:hypothetical protein
VLCLYLFFSLKLDVSRQRRRWMRQQLELEAALDEMRASFEQQDLESPRAATLRRVRHGSPLESAEQVAAA